MLAEISLALLRNVVTSRHVALGFKHVLEVPLEWERLWELVAVWEVVCHVLAHTDEEHSLTVLRNSVGLGVENLPVVVVAVAIQLVAPLLEKWEELFANKCLHVLKHAVRRAFCDNGSPALPQERAACA